MLIASRILQGISATIMAPQVLASIRVMFPASEQGTALAFYAATFGAANVLGQIGGGVLVSSGLWGFTWQTAFLVNLPLGLIAFVGAAVFLAESRAEHEAKLDLRGVGLLSLSLALLVYPLVQGREDHWPWWSGAMLAAVPLLLAVFARFERSLQARGGSPLVDMSLLRTRGVALGMLIAVLYYMLSAFYLTYAIYLQGGLGLSAGEAGLRTVPFGIGFSFAALFSARLMRQLGPRALTLGLGVQMIGFGALAWLVARPALEFVPAALVIAGFGFGTVMPAVISAVVSAADSRHAGLASGVLISTFQIGAALGVAIVGGVFFSVLGDARDTASYASAFRVALACNIALLGVAALLSLRLRTGARA
jgi:MFS family permease